jgi:hypothetical protein
MRAAALVGRPGKQPDGSAKTREGKLVTVWTAEGCDNDGIPVRAAGSVTYSAALESAATRDTDARAATRAPEPNAPSRFRPQRDSGDLFRIRRGASERRRHVLPGIEFPENDLPRDDEPEEEGQDRVLTRQAALGLHAAPKL